MSEYFVNKEESLPRVLDFSYFANLHGRITREDAPLLRLGLIDQRLSDDEFSTMANAHCENIYRASSMLAFSKGLACLKDVSYFVEQDVSPVLLKSLSAYRATTTAVFINIEDSTSDAINLSDRIPYSQQVSVWDGATETMLETEASVEISQSKLFRVFTLITYQEANGLDGLAPIKLLAQLAVNEFAKSNYIGMFDGKPEFKASCGIESIWQSIAELSETQLPGVCPACGKIVDRMIRSGGGKPPIACCKKHIDSYNNEKKRLIKTSDPNMQFKDKREMKARELRWRDSNNQRPFLLPGIQTWKEEKLKQAIIIPD
ncbi:hypothetical protein GMI69_07205 [Eggerthellaceae bacterium zg-887]|uniref:hypothetical protein n=1 Tax=Xiamenia xianingshaonis TaxID=2682776 RepID=UPI001408AE41|nr:hypothetical protein [Xiamenia xianingshaonis]NGM18031.1 hypothetical protein [Eggerthellaceae bacterium zg-893]NHM16441.1 hypothetical protein [Xiamenia xianingshaonis]